MKILILDDEMFARQELSFLVEHSQEVDNPEIFRLRISVKPKKSYLDSKLI